MRTLLFAIALAGSLSGQVITARHKVASGSTLPTLLSGYACEYLGMDGGTTVGSLDTTNATLIHVAYRHYVYSGSITFADSVVVSGVPHSNSWTSLAPHGGETVIETLYVIPTYKGTGHTFAVTGSTVDATICYRAYSGTALTDVFQTGTDNGVSSLLTSAPIQSGSDGSPSGSTLVIATVGANNGAGALTSIDSGFAHVATLDAISTNGLSVADLYQASGSAVNPTWVFPTPSAGLIPTIAAFKGGHGGTSGGAENNVTFPDKKVCTGSAGDLTCQWNVDTVTGDTACVFLTFSNSANASPPTDSQLNTWLPQYDETETSRVWRHRAYCAINITGGTTPTVTAHMDFTTSHLDMFMILARGVAAAPIDGIPSVTGTTAATSFPSGTVTTTNANDALIHFCTMSDSSPTVASGFTSQLTISGESALSTNLVTSTGAYNPACTGSSQNGTAGLVALKSN